MVHELLPAFIIGLPLVAIASHLLCLQCPKTSLVVQCFYALLWLIIASLLYATVNQRWIIELGNWPAPYGITLVVDKPSALMLVIFTLSANAVSLYSIDDPDLTGKRIAYYIGFWLLALGMTGAIFTHDIFNLYVCMEMMLVSALINLCCTKRPEFQAVFNYAVMNIFATLIVLLAIAVIYAQAGTLNYSSLANYFSEQKSWRSMLGVIPLLLGLGIKGGLFPLYFWLPQAYPATSYSATMLVSSIITKVVFFVLLRLMILWPIINRPELQWVLAFIAVATMVVGVIGAGYQYQIRAILSFHIVSQMGYVLLAVIMSGLWAVVAAIFFLIHNILVKTALLMISGIVERTNGTDYLPALGRIVNKQPVLSVAFFLTAMSLAGIPPLSGFWGKLLIVKTALSQHFFISAGIALLVSLLTIYSMCKIWRHAFCQNPHYRAMEHPGIISKRSLWALAPLVLIPLIMGVDPDIVLNPLMQSADQFGKTIPLMS
jgi:multicomponent Na+:H+ antiporter subunit D